MLRLFCLLLISLARPLAAATFEEANARYAAGDYAAAAAAFEELIAADGPTAARLYNLGNARFRLKEFGPAILAFERAAWFAPRDPDIEANLKLARESGAVPDSTPPAAWPQSAARTFSLHEWSWLTAGGVVLLAAAATTGGILGLRRPGVRRFAIGGTLAGFIAGAVGGSALWIRRGESRLGIITAADSTLRLSPFPEASPAGSPGSGRTVIVGERHNEWVRVTVAGAELSGWIPEKHVSLIAPGDS